MGAKSLKLNVRNYSNFIITSPPPPYRVVQVIFSRFYLKFKMATTVQLQFFVGAKTLKINVRNHANFTILAPTIWRCAGSATDQLQFFLWAKKLKDGISSNFVITIWRCAGDFFWVLMNLKKPPWMSFIIFCGRKNSNIEVRINSHFTITSPTIWKCAGDFSEI